MKRAKLNPIKHAPIFFTRNGYERYANEKKQLLKKRPDAVMHLKLARDMGDLSENGYYRASRQKLSTIDSRLRKLEYILRLGRIVESVQSDHIEIGSLVTLRSNATELSYTIVGTFESNPEEGSISYKSPLGIALMNKKSGDTVVLKLPRGEVSYTIIRIE